MGKENSIVANALALRSTGQMHGLTDQNRMIHRNGISGAFLRVAATAAFLMLVGCGYGSGGGDTAPVPPPLWNGAPVADWMANVPNNTPISLLGIPGTHDTGTYNQGSWAWGGWVKTQERSILDQLERGIRFLDIRGRLIGDTLAIHHGSVYLGLTFQDVIDVCRQFLQQHPTETILMNLGDEYEHDSTSTYHQVFLKYYNNNRYLDDTHTRELWELGTTIPTLGSVRGKIVLIRSFALDPPATALGIEVPGGQNSAYYSHQFSANPEQTLYIENLWTPADCDNAYTDKANAIAANTGRKQFDRSQDHLYMTFTSGTGGSGWCYKTPRNFADAINPWLVTALQPKLGPVGIVAMDFPGDDLIGRIIDSNNY